MKSDRLKKLESELSDLEKWMKLGLVPKKELLRHEQEILQAKELIEEERGRLQFLRESGDLEEYSAPRRTPHKTVYPDTPTMSDIEVESDESEGSVTMENTATEVASEEEGKEPQETTSRGDEAEDDYDPFSDRNRWKRGGIIDPDATEW